MEFAEAVVTSKRVLFPCGIFGAATVDDGVGPLCEFFVVGEEGAAFTSGEDF
jgi:hypothetical protein